MNYFKTHRVSIWGTPGVASSGLLIVLGGAFLVFSMLQLKTKIHQDFNRKLKNNELSNWKRMYGSLLLITDSAIIDLIAIFVGFLFLSFPFSLLFIGLINSLTGGYIPALFVRMLMIILATGETIPQKSVIFLLLLVHLSSLWTYAQSLPLKEQSNFPQGFAEAVQKDVDIKSIHQAMKLC
ncbi:hypothetical protein [Oscillatoria sp. FACHB-1406]|uniref:hypothetical protein n=1 Tax=Oscillatoria sp. FACHB-1406 TaxID=2692846 RepID=UPI00168222BB|nr:hypothetical protein [Oscillatoria sp. FACHB-1406]MBD2580034.1 hypothetical protein [Oscillatoria sp. FACHB-1406]